MSCKICGKKSGIYPLCNDCFKLRDEGKITKCDDCGEWHYTSQPCKCKKTIVKEPPKENVTSDLTCIVCGENSNGKHFCYDCYNKYKERSIDIRISNCLYTQVIDEYGNKTKKTKDGRSVRSLSEKIIIDYFFDNFIRVVYEKTIPYVNEKGEDAVLRPDFYLPDYDLFIEFNGLTNKSYLRKKNYALKIYEEKGYKVVILESQDIDDIEGTLPRILSKYKKK